MSFLRDYCLYTSGNESPAHFHTWAGLSALSSLASRRFWIDQGHFVVRPNMYVLLVGNAGIKKSTAMSHARKLIKKCNTIPIQSALTKEALTQYMAEDKSPCRRTFKYNDKTINYSHLSIFGNEIVSLLNAGGNPTGMIDFLTDVWDQDMIEIRTKNKGVDMLEGPFITILGCMTPETMAQLFYQKIISGGFNRRCIFVFADKNERAVPRPEVTPEQAEAWERCFKRAQEINKMSGKFEWSDEAFVTYDSWYYENFELRENCKEDIVFQGYLNSKGEYVLKLAMLIALSEGNELVIQPAHIETALAFLEQVEPGYKEIFAGSGRNELGAISSAIESLILRAPEPILISRIYAQFRKDADKSEIDRVLDHLVKAEVITLSSLTMVAGQRNVNVAHPSDFDIEAFVKAKTQTASD